MENIGIHYTRIKSNCLADTIFDPVTQHMKAWHIYQHEMKIHRAKPREKCHVNPGREAALAKNGCVPSITPPLRSFSRLSLRATNRSSPASMKSQQSAKPKCKVISFSSHLESHKKHGDFISEMTFKPKILATPIPSKLKQSRNYQPPKKKSHAKSRPGSAISSNSNGSEKQDNNRNVQETWSRSRLESSSSSSTGCDSAYEAGGSIEGLSPQSRGSTPQPEDEYQRPKVISKDDELSRIVGEEIEEAIEEIIERPNTPINLMERNEDLDYILFEHDMMSEIALTGVVTNLSVRELCKSFASTRGKSLEDSKVNEIINRVQETLGIPDNESLDYLDFGFSNNPKF
ncbi:uncharacterized protein LOC132194141 [Neocloeon triangulifer]|uniref:uncharacterized protein LOC132194141 n=1 Tax=Neocloeon triangulifer TaxID=2078957 RepID=UPI00286ECABD|nr:uncharacterized protein LOC132194141 [Neocloeon triangulifer]